MDYPVHPGTHIPMSRSPVPSPSPQLPPVERNIPSDSSPKYSEYSGTLTIAVFVLLFLCVGLMGYIGVLSLRLKEQDSGAEITSVREVAPLLSDQPTDSSVQEQAVVKTGEIVPTQEDTVKKIEEKMLQMGSDSSIANIYSKSLDQAIDIKKKADLSALATAMNIYLYEYDGSLPDNFPDEPRCIGMGAGCYDLYKFLVPTYLDKAFMDPEIGTLENSGYSIGTSHDENTLVFLRAIGASGEVIEVRK